MIAKKMSGHKVFITDLDGPIGDCQKTADELGIGKIYSTCRSNPVLLQEKLNGVSNEFYLLSKKLLDGFEINDGVHETLKDMKKIGYDNFACTDNPIFAVKENGVKYSELFKERFRDGKLYYLDEVHTTLIPQIENNKLKLKPNGSKDNFIRDKFNEYESGVLVVEDENDLELARTADEMKRRYDIKILRYGNKCKELEEYADDTIFDFEKILDYA